MTTKSKWQKQEIQREPYEFFIFTCACGKRITTTSYSLFKKLYAKAGIPHDDKKIYSCEECLKKHNIKNPCFSFDKGDCKVSSWN